MSRELTINAKCSECNTYTEISCTRNEQTFVDTETLLKDDLTFKFSHDKKTVLKMLQILYNCYSEDVKQCKKDFKKLNRNEYLELLAEKQRYFRDNKTINSEMIDDSDYYICSNLKFIEDAFYFKRCDKCKALLNVVAVYSV
jgi:hypothetical protein